MAESKKFPEIRMAKPCWLESVPYTSLDSQRTNTLYNAAGKAIGEMMTFICWHVSGSKNIPGSALGNPIKWPFWEQLPDKLQTVRFLEAITQQTCQLLRNDQSLSAANAEKLRLDLSVFYQLSNHRFDDGRERQHAITETLKAFNLGEPLTEEEILQKSRQLSGISTSQLLKKLAPWGRHA